MVFAIMISTLIMTLLSTFPPFHCNRNIFQWLAVYAILVSTLIMTLFFFFYRNTFRWLVVFAILVSALVIGSKCLTSPISTWRPTPELRWGNCSNSDWLRTWTNSKSYQLLQRRYVKHSCGHVKSVCTLGTQNSHAYKEWSSIGYLAVDNGFLV